MLQEKEKIFGLIGYPLTHSFSASYFTQKFKNEHLFHCRYLNFSIKSLDNIQGVLETHPNLVGFNVTIPYKEKIISKLDELSYLVQEVNAVNTVLVTKKGLMGYNTDVHGFRQSLLNWIPNPGHLKALILGTGGASKAVKYALRDLGLSYKTVSRAKGKDQLTYGELDKHIIRSHQLIINTTPLGMYPKIEDAPDIPFNLINEQHFLMDLIYNPEKTLFLERGKSAGAKIKNGEEMLILQAEKSWEIWNQYNSS